jgi:hypothetical protein
MTPAPAPALSPGAATGTSSCTSPCHYSNLPQLQRRVRFSWSIFHQRTQIWFKNLLKFVGVVILFTLLAEKLFLEAASVALSSHAKPFIYLVEDFENTETIFHNMQKHIPYVKIPPIMISTRLMISTRRQNNFFLNIYFLPF